MVPVEEADDADDESSSGSSVAGMSGRSENVSMSSSCSSSGIGGGMLASLALAKDRCRSLMVAWGRRGWMGEP